MITGTDGATTQAAGPTAKDFAISELRDDRRRARRSMIALWAMCWYAAGWLIYLGPTETQAVLLVFPLLVLSSMLFAFGWHDW